MYPTVHKDGEYERTGMQLDYTVTCGSLFIYFFLLRGAAPLGCRRTERRPVPAHVMATSALWEFKKASSSSEQIRERCHLCEGTGSAKTFSLESRVQDCFSCHSLPLCIGRTAEFHIATLDVRAQAHLPLNREWTRSRLHPTMWARRIIALGSGFWRRGEAIKKR